MKRFYDPQYPFRQGHVKPAPKKRIEKVKDRSLKSFHYQTAYATVPWNYWGFAPVMSYVFGPVVFKFFLPQYFQKIKFTRRPIKHVDHPLDEKVPFTPAHLPIYMDFVNVWIRPITMMVHRYGIWNGSKLGGEFLCYIKKSYEEAWRMYRQCFTTTYRPKSDVKGIVKLRKADPHYMCVPSLHIAIVCLCFGFYRMLFEREHFTEYEAERWNAELFARAVEIGETVLYIKQHSVNCIPAALYMVTRCFPEIFNPDYAVEFINALFVSATDVSEEDRRKIHEHIHFMYERMLLEGAMEEDWTVPVLRWLESYEPYTPSYAD